MLDHERPDAHQAAAHQHGNRSAPPHRRHVGRIEADGPEGVENNRGRVHGRDDKGPLDLVVLDQAVRPREHHRLVGVLAAIEVQREHLAREAGRVQHDSSRGHGSGREQDADMPGPTREVRVPAKHDRGHDSDSRDARGHVVDLGHTEGAQAREIQLHDGVG